VGSIPLPEDTSTPVEPICFTAAGREPLFRTMKRIYQFLDSCKQSPSDTPILLSVDREASRIVNSYFYDMNDNEYKNFSIAEGEVKRYPLPKMHLP
ncbi:MAG: hypothetical protein Q4F76_12275, partial [Lachnospiraceae bacterium]|nr:hypothetical protein [Lachnospiraceae bacterium]